MIRRYWLYDSGFFYRVGVVRGLRRDVFCVMKFLYVFVYEERGVRFGYGYSFKFDGRVRYTFIIVLIVLRGCVENWYL